VGIFDFLRNLFRRQVDPQPYPTHPFPPPPTTPPGAVPLRAEPHKPPHLPENPKAEEPIGGPKVPLEALKEVHKKPPIPVGNRGITSICPYCQQDLKKVPQVKRKCPHCQKTCYVKYLPFYKQKSLVTEQEAAMVDAYWARYRPVREWLDRLRDYGITEDDFDLKHKELSEKAEEAVSDRGIIWALFNELASKVKDPGTIQSLFLNIATFLHKGGEDHHQYLEISIKAGLLSMKQMGIEKVQIFNDESSCRACRKLNKKIFTIDEALEKMPLPVKTCTLDVFGMEKGFCRCFYAPVVD
jgi:hypothetical protein